MVVADAEVAAALGTGRRTQGDQALLPANHAVPGDAAVAANIVTVGDIEAHAVDVDVCRPRIGDHEG